MNNDAVGSWGRRTTDSLRDWVRRGIEGPTRADAGQPNTRPSTGRATEARPVAQSTSAPSGDLSHYASRPDPWPELLKTMSSLEDDNRWRMLYGCYCDHFVTTEPRTHLLILGPPRVNKSAGVLIPLVLAAPGPVVSCSTRDDILRACASTRSRMGRIWHFTPDGSPTAPGAIPLRWSPLTTSWKQAKTTAMAILTTAESAQAEARNGRYFADQAARLVAPTLLAAALSARSMEWATSILISQDPDAFQEVQELLIELGDEAPGVKNALNTLSGILGMPGSHGSAADIYATAARAFEVYNDPDVIAATEPANFDPAHFVAGQPDVINPGLFTAMDHAMATGAAAHLIQDRLPRGVYDTIFITADDMSHEAVAPIIVGLLSSLHLAAQRQTQVDQANNHHGRPPMTWALDEVAGMAPWPRFPKVLSTCAGSNVLVAAVFQDLSQAEAKWRNEAKGLRTLMRHTVVFPGVENSETTKEISDRLGKHWVTTWNENYGTSTGSQTSNSSGFSQSQQHLPVMDPGDITKGHPTDPTAVLALTPRGSGHAWMHPMPYYATPPWAEVIIGSLVHLGTFGGPADPRAALPIPSLDRDGGAHLRPWRHPDQVAGLVQALNQHRQWQRDVVATQGPAPTPEAVAAASSFQGAQTVELVISAETDLDDVEEVFERLQSQARGASPATRAAGDDIGDDERPA